MPYGMSGPELVEKLRVLKPDLKVIFMSGYSVDEVDVELNLVDGVNFLQKPYGPEALAKIVRQRLDT
jgi:FixJ family two-component response regulator